MIERDRWPGPVVSSASTRWPDSDGAPTADVRDRLARLVRPVHAVLQPAANGYLFVPWLSRSELDGLIALEDEWSTRMWAALATRQTKGSAGALAV